jgi:hypothetical protein
LSIYLLEETVELLFEALIFKFVFLDKTDALDDAQYMEPINLTWLISSLQTAKLLSPSIPNLLLNLSDQFDNP